MSSTVNLKALGLNKEINQIEAPPGSLSTASNVIIRRDDVIESRRGFKLYGEPFGTSTDVAKQLMTYKQRILRHYTDILSYDTGTVNESGQAIFDNFSGSFTEPTSGIRIKSTEANGNLYFTTDNGIQRISAKTGRDLTTDSGFIVPAGGAKALDVSTALSITLGNQIGMLPDDSVVAYRILWGLIDENGNAILGTPSQRSVIYNPLLQMIVRDLGLLLSKLDDVSNSSAGSLITDGNYFDTLNLPLNSLSDTVKTNLLALSTKLDNDILIANDGGTASLTTGAIVVDSGTPNVATVIFTNNTDANNYFSVGSHLYLTNSGITALNTNQTVTAVSYASGNITAFTTSGGYSKCTTSTPHGLSVGDYVTIASASVAMDNGIFKITAVPTSTTFVTNGGRGTSTTATYVKNLIKFNTSASPITHAITTISIATGAQITSAAHGLSVNNFITIRNGDSTPAANGIFKVLSVVDVNNFTIDLVTTGAGSSGTWEKISTTSSSINSYEFRNLTAPLPQDSPATHAELQSLSDYLGLIEATLVNLPSGILAASDNTTYIAILAITTTANVNVTFTIPDRVTTNYYYQIYRSDIKTATTTDVLADLIPDDEMRLVYEAFPTSANIATGVITVLDSTPEEFIQGSTFLYTNENSGEGILQANDLPPLSQDINRFKNYIFYANTATLQRLNITLLGVQNILDSYNNGNTTQNITVTDGTTTNQYKFVKGINQIITLSPVHGASYNSSGTASYFVLFDGYNNGYYVWFNVSGGTQTDPAISGFTGIRVDITGAETVAQICKKLADTIALSPDAFTETYNATTVAVTNVTEGYAGSDVISSYNHTPGGFTLTISTAGTGERLTQQQQTLQTVADVAGSLAGKYFTLNDIYNQTLYYFWFSVSGSGSDPVLSGRTGFRVNISTGATAQTVATTLKTSIDTNLSDRFATTTPSSGLFTITNVFDGPCGSIGNGTSGFSHTLIEAGATDVLLSTQVSPTLAVDATAQSLVRVINRNNNEIIYAYYLSTSVTAPGQILLEAKQFDNSIFYVVSNTEITGNSFTPNLAPSFVTLSNTAANPTVITVNNHGFHNGDSIVIVNSNCLPTIDGVHVVSNVTTNTFTIPVIVASAGNVGSVIESTAAEFSDNEAKGNRIYYSKFQQPDAVPIVNSFDVGIENKAILRIFPIRDSLFVFKEDGIYRVSGDSAPFTINLFDSSAILVAPDSVDVANNVIYGWTRQGIVTVNESGVSILSRPIDTDIFKLASSNYVHFSTATWGVGYVSDNSYLVFTVKQIDDEIANIAYRYSSLTNTWTTYDKTNTCGIVNPVDDKLYLGAGDTNFLEIERKTFTRLDYADREIISQLLGGNYLLNNSTLSLLLPNQINNCAIGDVITQEQYITVYIFNGLLKKLDLDVGTHDKDYYSTLFASGGDNIRSKLEDLADKLDNDSGVNESNFASSIADLTFTITNNTDTDPTIITTSTPHGLVDNRVVVISGSNSQQSINGTFQVTVIDSTHFSIPVSVLTQGSTGSGATLIEDFRDIQACYNKIISLLNENTNLVFSNYKEITQTTTQEVIITSINKPSKIVTVNYNLPFITGPLTIFKSIDCEFLYSSITMGDPLNLKHLRELQIYFDNKAFSQSTLSVSSDLIPSYTDIAVPGAGNGIFGIGTGKFGLSQFGGASNSIPFRTYIPRNAQRCRYLNIKFNHSTAREIFAIYGMSVTGEISSTRAYK